MLILQTFDLENVIVLLSFFRTHSFPDILYDSQNSFDFQNIGQGHDSQHPPWRHSMVNYQSL